MREHAFIRTTGSGHAIVFILEAVSDMKNVTGINVTPDNLIYITTTWQKSNSRGVRFIPAVGKVVALGERR